MKTEDSRQKNVVEEAMAECRPWLPFSRRARDVLATVAAVAALFGVLWWIGYSLVSGLENRLIERMDINHRELSTQIEGMHRNLSAQIERVERNLSAQIEGVGRGMVEGIEQPHQRMDRMDRRMDRIESDIDAIKKHLYRIGAVDGSEEAPAAGAPAVAKPHRSVSSMGAVQSSNESATPPSEEGKSLRWTEAAPHIAGQDSLGDLGSSGDTLPVDR